MAITPSPSSWIRTWLQYVAGQTGITPILYCDRSSLQSLDSDLQSDYPLWIADWDTNSTLTPTYNGSSWPGWDFKQYQSVGSTCPGIIGGIDLDSFNGGTTALNALVIGGGQSSVVEVISTIPSGLLVSVDGAAAVSTPDVVNWTTGSAHTIFTATGQFSPDGHTRYDFLSWSDGGVQSHSVSPTASGIYLASFSTNYLLQTTASPLTGGAIMANPTGPWYAPETTIVLTATPQSGYVFSSWIAEDSYSNNTAVVVMNSYRSVTANFSRITAPTFSAITITAGALHLTASGLLPGKTD